MSPQKMLEMIDFYKKRLDKKGIPEKRMDTGKRMRVLDRDAVLAHANWALRKAKNLFLRGGNFPKVLRRYIFIQSLLFAAGEYSIDELEKHNKG